VIIYHRVSGTRRILKDKTKSSPITIQEGAQWRKRKLQTMGSVTQETTQRHSKVVLWKKEKGCHFLCCCFQEQPRRCGSFELSLMLVPQARTQAIAAGEYSASTKKARATNWTHVSGKLNRKHGSIRNTDVRQPVDPQLRIDHAALILR
jgi:hypothetical protein